MAPGLLRMLDLIKSSPANDRLVDRYLVLVADLKPAERADATLKLAETLIRIAPKRALDIAWGLFKVGTKEEDSLEIIALALETLGKPARAALVRSETQRLKVVPLAYEVSEHLRKSVEESISAAVSGDKGDLSAKLDEVTKGHKPILTEAELVASPDIKIEKVAEIQFDLGAHTPAPQTVLIQNQTSPERVFSSVAPQDQLVQTRDSNPVAHRESVARVSAAMPGAGIPEAIPPKEPSRHSMAMLEKKPAISIQRSQADLLESNIDPYPIESMAPADLKQRFKELLASENWEILISFLNESSNHWHDPILLDVFPKKRLQMLDVRFAAAWIDILTGARQERRALRFMIHCLIEEPHLAWARMIWSKIKPIQKSLNLNEFDWRESEGVTALRSQIEQLRPRTRCYCVPPLIAS